MTPNAFRLVNSINTNDNIPCINPFRSWILFRESNCKVVLKEGEEAGLLCSCKTNNYHIVPWNKSQER